MRNYESEFAERTAFIKKVVSEAKADGIVYGNSGGKDSALVGILCKAACENTVGIIMPCTSKRNFNEDLIDGKSVAEKFKIETRIADLSNVKESMISALSFNSMLTGSALANISPRLRMTALYAIAGSENRLVAGTGNKSEGYMGYFTKWGDGAYDFNPISDLTVTEIYEFLEYLDAPEAIIKKSPSAGLFDGQTDEAEMGVSYKTIDSFLNGDDIPDSSKKIIERYHSASEHKRKNPLTFK